MGHELEIRDYRGVGSVKAILIDPDTGALMGGVSPTGDSYVVGEIVAGGSGVTISGVTDS